MGEKIEVGCARPIGGPHPDGSQESQLLNLGRIWRARYGGYGNLKRSLDNQV